MALGNHLGGHVKSFIALISFGVLLLNLQSCSPESKTQVQEITIPAVSSDGIIGGQEMPKSFAMENGIVGIIDISSGGICTGSLLPNNLILTAAHCVSDPKKALIIFDENMQKIIQHLIDRTSPEVVQETVRLVDVGRTNAKYAQTMQEMNDYADKALNGRKFEDLAQEERTQILEKVFSIKDHGDIALLHFTGTTPQGYKPATVATLKESGLLTNGTDTTLSGYGLNNGVENTGSEILRSVEGIKVSDNKFSQTEIQLDQRQGKGACRGDSGGPAFVKVDGKLKLWGVTSRGDKDPNNDCSQFVIYTHINAWQTWIKMTSEELLNQSKALQAKAKTPNAKQMLIRQQPQR